MYKSVGCLFFILSFFIEFTTNAQNKVFKDFVSTVDSIYNDLTFNDVALKDIRVNLKNHHNGVAFAYENPNNGKKYILINYQYLFKKVWQNDRYKNFKDSTDRKKIKIIDIRTPIIKGILIHEWAHHFLNHNLMSSNIVNERNADILSGRIMKEDIEQNGKEYLIDAVVELFSNLPDDKHHLPDKARRNMIFKGKQTYDIIKNDNKPLCDVANKSMEEELAKAKRNKMSDYKRCYREELTKERRRLIINSKLALSDSLLKLLNKNLPKIDTALRKSPFISTNLDFDPTLNVTYKNINKRIDSVATSLGDSLKIDSVTKNFQKILNQKLIASEKMEFTNCQKILIERDSLTKEQFGDDSSMVVESLYNKCYFKKDTVKCNCANSLIKNYKTSENDIPKHQILFYKLNGGLRIEIDLKKTEKEKEEKAVTVIKNNKERILLKFLTFNKNDKDAKFFKGYFEIMQGNKQSEKFYLDNNYHLWTETIAAKSIENKLFLERFTIK